MISSIDDTASTNEDLIARMERDSSVLRSERIKAAFRAVLRADFVGDDYLSEAYEDYPLPIGYGQTISQPTTVAFMLELLDAAEGDRVLDVGSGSGWTTALLAHLVGKKGRVVGVERIPELVLLGQKNLAKYDFKNASIREAGDVLGAPDEVPFERILVSASADELPRELVVQLKEGGTMVIPIKDTLYKIEKARGGSLKKTSYPGFAFVPLLEGKTRGGVSHTQW